MQSLDPVPEVLIGKWCDSNPASDPPFPSLIQCCCPLLMSQAFERLVWRSKLTSPTGYLMLYLHLWRCLRDKHCAQLPVCVLDGFHDGCNNSSASSTKIGDKINCQRIWKLIISWICRHASLTLWSWTKHPFPEVIMEVLKEWAICRPSSLWQSWIRGWKVRLNEKQHNSTSVCGANVKLSC